MKQIEQLAQKPPFLFVDKIIESGEQKIVTSKVFKESDFYFQGHFPGLPIVPGVLLCEAVFQSSALILSQNAVEDREHGVVTKIDYARFKGFVRAGDEVVMEVQLIDQLDTVSKFKSVVRLNKNIVLKVGHSCGLVSDAQIRGL